MNAKEQRDRKFTIMKNRSHPQRYEDANALSLAQHRELADRQYQFMQMHHLELLVQSRRHSNALEALVDNFVKLCGPAPKQEGASE